MNTSFSAMNNSISQKWNEISKKKNEEKRSEEGLASNKMQVQWSTPLEVE